MTTQIQKLFLVLMLWNGAFAAHAQSTAFTYTGRLNNNTVPVNGAYDIRFTLYDANAAGNVVAGPLTVSPVDVTNGLFIVRIDFGADVFTGPPRWLNIEVHPVGELNFISLSPRQEVTSSPYAIRAASAGTAADVSAGSVVKSVNTLKDDVTLAAGGNVTITPAGNTLTIAAAGVGGSGIWSLNGGNAYYDAGNVGIGTSSPTPGVRLDVIGITRVAPGSGGSVAIGSPNGERGISIGGNLDLNRADLRFDGSTLKLVAGLGNGPPPSANGIVIDPSSGSVGIGTGNTITPGVRLEVNGVTRLATGGSGGAIGLGAPNGETGMSLSGVNRADVRFDGSTLKLLAGPGVGPPSSANGIAITTAGYVGIGTTAPVAKLHAETSQANTAAVYGNATGSGGVGVYGQSASGSAVHAQGNATQLRDKGGFVKAMAYIDPYLPASQYVVRCYNSQQAGNAASTSPCGITVTRSGPGSYRVDFGFDVRDRFISVTSSTSFRTVGVSPVGNGNPNAVEVGVYSTIADVEDDTEFFIFVF